MLVLKQKRIFEFDEALNTMITLGIAKIKVNAFFSHIKTYSKFFRFSKLSDPEMPGQGSTPSPHTHAL